MFNLKKINNIYLTLIGYILLYVLYYCVLTVVIVPYGISVAVTTALALALTINSIRRREKKRDIGYKKALGLNKVKLDKKEVIVLMMLGIGLNFVISGVLNILPAGLSESYAESYTVVLGGDMYSMIIVMALVTPFLEEIFFRGIFQRKLSERYGDFKGLIIATCIFGFMHFNIIWSIYAAVIGFFLGCIYTYYNSIFPCAIVHGFFNLLSCIPVFMARYEKIYKYTFGSKIYVVFMLIAGIAIIYYVVEKTWIKMFFEKSFLIGRKTINEVDNNEVD